MENERKRERKGDLGPSPLPGGDYYIRGEELGLINPIPSDLDTNLRKTCDVFQKLPDQERNKFRRLISPYESYTLLTFARRSSVFALREQNADILEDSLIAISMIEAKRTDFRDILAALSLIYHSAVRINMDSDRAFYDAAQLAEPQVQEMIVGFTKRSADEKSISQSWGYREVKTKFGLGYVRWGFCKYNPETDLLDIAIKIATMIDNDNYNTTSIQIGTDLPDVWLKSEDSEGLETALKDITGGLTISAQLEKQHHSDAASQQFTVFIIELRHSESAKLLSYLAQAKQPDDFCMLGTRVDRLFCLLITRSFVMGVSSFESGDSLLRFQSKFHEILKDSKADQFDCNIPQ